MEKLPGLIQLDAAVAGGADLSPVGSCAELRRIGLWSEGGIRLPTDGLEQLLEVSLVANRGGMAPESPCELQVSGPLPELLMLRLSGGVLPSLSLLEYTPALQLLDLYGTNLEALDLGPVGGLQQLRAVSLMVSYDDTLDLAPLAACPALEVCLVPNGGMKNPPPQAAADPEEGLPKYNQVNLEVYDAIFARCGWLEE